MAPLALLAFLKHPSMCIATAVHLILDPVTRVQAISPGIMGKKKEAAAAIASQKDGKPFAQQGELSAREENIDLLRRHTSLTSQRPRLFQIVLPGRPERHRKAKAPARRTRGSKEGSMGL
ncbi:hypothetical protein IE81DRAFT_325391 [Ceraceosorus guamensis]|uniref:Uncharacterized protein n=1 Tax=Ceraceosorus guamensis TaxID=1522189 RepID=A0A316VVZ4_9BASI|nr:hypothetical protein IE81DRAFT_325391 [Ceraceosorus guamensis]PWN40603.1 hypothetical protein IE81DRAFT_325391 [Ceraceosorus guamensis]